MATAALGEKTKPGHECVSSTAEMKTNNATFPGEILLSRSLVHHLAAGLFRVAHRTGVSFKCPSSGSICNSHVGWICETQRSSKVFLLPFSLPGLQALLSACEVLLLAPYIASLQFLNEQQLCCSFKIRICHHPFTDTLFSNVRDKD